jgi:hypothetical protein
MRPTGNKRRFHDTTSQVSDDIFAAAVSAPAIVRVGSLMPVRGIVMPLQKNYYAFCDRLWVKSRYESGELRGPILMLMIEERVLQVPPAVLAHDLARWGTGELSLAAREQRRKALWPRLKDFHHLIQTRTDDDTYDLSYSLNRSI